MNPIEPYAGTGAPVDDEDEALPRQNVVVEVGGRRVKVSLPGQFSLGNGGVVKVAVTEAEEVVEGDLIAVLDAMKMENPVNAHKAGVVTGLSVEPGAAITQRTVLAELK